MKTTTAPTKGEFSKYDNTLIACGQCGGRVLPLHTDGLCPVCSPKSGRHGVPGWQCGISCEVRRNRP